MSIRILVVDDEVKARTYLSEILENQGYAVTAVATLNEAREVVQREQADVILLDVMLNGEYGPDLLKETRHLPEKPPIILVTAHGHIDMAVEAMKDGAHDFLTKPIDLNRLLQAVQTAAERVQMRRELAYYREQQWRDLPNMVSQNPVIQQLLDLGLRAAMAQTPILITGETGTGKSLLAMTIHMLGPRKNKPFIVQNCAGIPDTLMESELFGYEKGAFSGADRRKRGVIELADGGTLFLDEISAMPIGLQPKLLRFLDTYSFRPLGNDKVNEVQVDVHIIAASNRNLKKMIAKGNFRGDLYHRLNVVELPMPPLRERREDIPSLVAYFLKKHGRQMGAEVQEVAPRALAALKAYSWPGNIRELENVIQRALLLCDGPMIDLTHLPPEVARSAD